ncbi:50S ribosomal protein L9 [Candidatus Magnetominusculus xianensis]|uniref:Large ribosomal subunit protein bL9 n=1 Tax=Candidatus Magnetominusculus xianensis TaxID=1748249 RepID=A0ABR5SGZ3_9BACT|nr:50S ribosomal protein L9 [Candidatus Magnetominusculus xianensis]KWT86803.1 50S ribosomal protein L9 [Candidatus Magnetominusculus xianensis]MBF0402479.1 50S ribosomal protein L9 [Nitrospirota bacterium]
MKLTKIILKEEVANLGDMGAIVNVARGYARNYLLPKNLAVEANTRNLKMLEHEKRIIAEKLKKLKVSADTMAARLSAHRIQLTAKAGEEGKLFGSITTKDISEALTAAGFDIDKKKILLDTHIKRVGEHAVKVKIHPQVHAQVIVEVTPE